eukprot:577911_1
MSMSFSTAELFGSTNGSMTQIRKGNTMKLNKSAHQGNVNATYTRRRHDPQDSSAFVHHVPHNSKDDHYRFYDDMGSNNVFDHDHVAENNNHHHHVKHNVSMASMTHGRGNTFSKYLLDDTLEVIDGDIPSQKEIMNDFFEERVTTHLQQQSSRFENMEPQIQMMQPQQQQQQPTQPQQHEPEDETHHELDDFGGTMRRIPSAATTPLDESDLINFCDMEDIDIPDYTD